MSEPLFDIIFRGDILPGHQLPEVKARLQQLFKVDAARVDALFSGSATPLKRNLDKAAADKYKAVLQKAGADIQLAPAGKVQAKARPQRQERTPPAALEKKLTLAERLAQQEAEQKAEEETKKQAEQNDSPFTLAPAGTDLLEASEKEEIVPVEVDVSALSLREQAGNLVDSSEQPHIEPVVVDVGDLELGELGADLLLEAEKKQQPDIEIDLSNMDLAPAGSDMGQLKDERPALNPDISGLSLEGD